MNEVLACRGTAGTWCLYGGPSVWPVAVASFAASHLILAWRFISSGAQAVFAAQATSSREGRP